MLALRLRQLWRGSEAGLARQWHAHAVAAAEHSPRRDLFLEATRCCEGDGRIRLGRTEDGRGGYQWCGLPLAELLAEHGGITGATGMGKSFLVTSLLYQLLQAKVPVVLADAKGELAALLRDLLVPALVAEGHDELLDQLRIVDPFDSSRVPLLRLTAREPRTEPHVQALNLAASLGEAVGQDLGPRMQRALLPAVGLAMERNLPLPVVVDWFRDPATFAREAATSCDEQIRAYALYELPRENRASIDALVARLQLVLHLPQVRRAFSAPRCLDFHECLDRGLTIFNFGSAPGGAESAMRLIAGPLLGRLSRAILSRDLTPETPQCVIAYEEVQEVAEQRHSAEQFKRLLSLCRFKRASLWFSTQSHATMAAVDRTLVSVLRTNLGTEIVFRSSAQDARALSDGLVTRAARESLPQARARFIEELITQPRRTYTLWRKSADYGPQRLRSPRLDLDQLARLGATLPPAAREQLRHGVASIDRAAFEAILAAGPTPEPSAPAIGLLAEGRHSRAPRLG